MRLLVTRPEPDALKLGAILEEAGHEAAVEPLLSVSFEGEAIDVDGAQALVATSRNALRALKASPALAQARRLPLFAVGKATADEARALGFAGVPDDPAVRLVAVEQRDAQWIQRALERSPAAGPFRVHQVGG